MIWFFTIASFVTKLGLHELGISEVDIMCPVAMRCYIYSISIIYIEMFAPKSHGDYSNDTGLHSIP